ncbi:NrfD/PsrC family molybdoenzyme membrane anchor subunit [Adlercreutzia sp. R25]|uniref:NrfD/PsrC family molybdoenzyme membrane anchor subunit n=1 Tax=Adlercreutzia shanghongiae TaxID=3111773 RepID=UPI002DBC7FF2|nr:NrfD/PsrC family molybdoenzyme membrane anchor subunit [Adlercreutzia sp. R25]MEC4273686.1 NrfD/PsrC family molybdoenzyme membrane anchor subunit [Adlercreutzia sp. R25]
MEELQLIWGWQPALYLFLGGLGAGTAVVAGIAYLKYRNAARSLVNGAMWVAVACLCAGLLLLVTELIAPLRGLMLWQSFSHFTSWMTFGAWVVFAAVVVFGCLALLTTPAVMRGIVRSSKRPPSCLLPGANEPYDRVRAALAVLSVVLGIGVAAYTGILLMSAPGVPLWNTPLLPCLFTVSALDTGVAAVELMVVLGVRRGSAPSSLGRQLTVAVLVLVVIETAVLAAFMVLAYMGNPLGGVESVSFAETAALSAALLVGGPLAPWFWVAFVLCALVVPGVSSALALVGKGGHGASACGAVSVLVGGCALRFLVLLAGLHVDYVADAFLAVLG